ncbi:MAG: efflux RND transporter periplasmic adaptor subunit [Reichenbachiella sp.]
MKSILGVLLLFAMASCGRKEQAKLPEATPVKVTAEAFSLTDVKESFQYSGKVRSDKQTVLSTKLLGHVQKVLVDEGEKVSKGQLVIQIKSKGVESKLAAARAGRQEAVAGQVNLKKNFDRINSLFEKGSATQRELDDITTNLNMANARVESVNQNIEELKELLTYANLKSPIDGFVSKKYINEGDMASPGEPILALESLDLLKIDLNVPAFEIAIFNEGDKVSVNFNSLEESFEGVVSRLIPSTASGTQFKVSIIISGSSKVIKPGMIGKVQLYKKSTQKMIIDSKYIHRKGQLQGVYLVNTQGQAMLRWLRLGEAHGSGFEVLSGLDQGELVITSTESKLSNGQKVEVSKSNEQ